ncbi:carbon storage regulator, partial [bacterium]
SIAADHVVLGVAFPDDKGEIVERRCSLELDDRVEIAAGTAVHVMAIRGDRVRLGIDAPGERPVTRQELRADAKPATRAGGKSPKAKPAATGRAGKSAGKRHRTREVVVAVDASVRIGLQMAVKLVDVDDHSCRLLVDGELVGGADDGLRVRETRELRIGSLTELGTQVQLVLEATRAGADATLLITTPNHLDVA